MKIEGIITKDNSYIFQKIDFDIWHDFGKGIREMSVWHRYYQLIPSPSHIFHFSSIQYFGKFLVLVNEAYASNCLIR